MNKQFEQSLNDKKLFFPLVVEESFLVIAPVVFMDRNKGASPKTQRLFSGIKTLRERLFRGGGSLEILRLKIEEKHLCFDERLKSKNVRINTKFQTVFRLNSRESLF